MLAVPSECVCIMLFSRLGLEGKQKKKDLTWSKQVLKRRVDFFFIGHTILSLHFPLLSVQTLRVKEIAEAEFRRGGPKVPEEGKSGDLLRIMERSCVCCFSAKSPSMPLFSSIA